MSESKYISIVTSTKIGKINTVDTNLFSYIEFFNTLKLHSMVSINKLLLQFGTLGRRFKSYHILL